jgi:hypothetical protein
MIRVAGDPSETRKFAQNALFRAVRSGTGKMESDGDLSESGVACAWIR